MTRLHRLVLTSIGSKVIVALTGLALAGFVFFHMLGNLQVFEGAESLNAYAAFLREMPILLWSARAGLVLLAGLHVGVAAQLVLHNWKARPTPYAVREYRRASVSSRTMAITGALLLLFIVFHVLHLSAGVVDPSYADRLDLRGQRDVFGKVVHAFRNVWFVAIYMAAQAVVWLHLSHAVSSSLQTLGVEHPALNPVFRRLGPAVAFAVVTGNCAIILAVALRVIP